MDTLGIDIGTTSVKYVRYRKKTDRIVSFGEYRYRTGSEDLRDILSTIREREGTRVVLAAGITSLELQKKTYSVPIQPEDEMRAKVDALVSKGMLAPLTDMCRQYIVLGEVEDRGEAKADVLFLGAHRSFVDHAVGLIRKAGFKRNLIFTDLCFCYQSMTDYAFDGAVAVVDIGGKQTGIYIFDGGRLLLVREIMTACETLKDAVVGDTALSPNEAEEHLWMKGFEESEEALSVAFERLAAQIQRTFLVYSQKYSKRPVAKAWITGRGAGIPGLPEKLNGLLTEQFDVLSSRAEVEPQYIPAYALATRGKGFPNLLAEERPDIVNRTETKGYVKAAGIMILSGIALFSLASWVRLHYLKAAVDAQLSVLSEKRQRLMGHAQTRQPGTGREVSISMETGQKEISFVLLLKYLSSHLPSQVYLKSIDFDASGTRGKTAGDKGIRPQPTPQETLRTGAIRLGGYVLGPKDDMETALNQVLASLEKSGFLTNMKIAHREVKTVKGKTFTEFVIAGECRGYEI